MTDNTDTSYTRTPTDFFAAVLRFADKGTQSHGFSDGKLSIAELQKAFRDRGIPIDNPFSEVISHIIKRSGRDEMSTNEIVRQFESLTGSGKSAAISVGDDGILSDTVSSPIEPVKPTDIDREHPRSRSIGPCS